MLGFVVGVGEEGLRVPVGVGVGVGGVVGDGVVVGVGVGVGSVWAQRSSELRAIQVGVGLATDAAARAREGTCAHRLTANSKKRARFITLYDTHKR